MLSCRGREISFCERVYRERDSLEYLLHLARSVTQVKGSVQRMKYYIVGSEYELQKKGVIERVSGISREFKLCHNFSRHHFICVDEQMIDSVVIRGRYARLVGRFNPNYYTITQSDKEEYHVLLINDKEKFWTENLYLVITHK